MPIPTAIRKNTGVQGLAEVRVLGDYLRVIFKKDGDTYQVNKNGWDRENGIFYVTLSKSNDEIKFVSPPGRDDPYLVKFLEFSNRMGRTEDNPGVPEPKIKPGGLRPGRNGGSYYQPDTLVTSAKLIVVEGGPYKGMRIPYELPYVFEQYPGSMITMLKGSANQNKKVEDFLRITGFDLVNDEIPFSPNVLPFLEAKLQDADKVFSVRLNEDGFVVKDSLASVPAYLITPDMLGEDEKPAKKPAKKAPAKKTSKK